MKQLKDQVELTAKQIMINTDTDREKRLSVYDKRFALPSAVNYMMHNEF